MGVAMDLPKIRVLVANKPRLIRELVLATITDQPDIEIVGEVREENQQEEVAVLRMLEETHPDFLIVALDDFDRRPSFCGRILEKHPHLRILALAAERESSVFYWASLDIHENHVETSEAGLLNALRSGQQAVGGIQ